MVTWIFLRVLPNLFKMMGLTYNDHICSSCVKGERGFGSQIPSSISRSHYKSFFFNGKVSLYQHVVHVGQEQQVLWKALAMSTLITSIRHRKRLIYAEKMLFIDTTDTKWMIHSYFVIQYYQHSFCNKKVLKWTNWWLLKQNELYRSVYFFTSLYFL